MSPEFFKAVSFQERCKKLSTNEKIFFPHHRELSWLIVW
jgi:hypothetical protein